MVKKNDFKIKIAIAAIIFLISFTVCISLLAGGSKEALDKSCKDLGYDKYNVVDTNLRYCTDSDGNLHFIELNCSGMIFSPTCIAKEIQVGQPNNNNNNNNSK